jgi:hypothetical protein
MDAMISPAIDSSEHVDVSLWSDLACYAVGVRQGVMIDVALSALKKRQI